MREDFENVKQRVDIRNLATMLLGQPIRQMYRYPGERTGSVKIYPQTQTFYDFGRGVGGDCIRLWAYIRHVDNWTALKEIKALYGLSYELDQNIKQCIRQQEKAREAARWAEEERKAAWRSEVDFWKKISESCDMIIRRSAEFSDEWCWAINQRQLAAYRLDDLCGLVRG